MEGTLSVKFDAGLGGRRRALVGSASELRPAAWTGGLSARSGGVCWDLFGSVQNSLCERHPRDALGGPQDFPMLWILGQRFGTFEAIWQSAGLIAKRKRSAAITIHLHSKLIRRASMRDARRRHVCFPIAERC